MARGSEPVPSSVVSYIAQAAASPRPLLWRLYSENLFKDMVCLLKIWDLREKAQKALGNQFDMRGFNDAVLKFGPVALDVPEEQRDTRIAPRR
jgi:hypothetical protein